MLMNQLPNAKFVGTIGYENSRDIPLEHVAFECANLTLAAGGVACDVTVLDTPDGVLLQHLLERDNIVFRPFGEGLLADDGKLTDYKLVSTAAISKKHDSFE